MESFLHLSNLQIEGAIVGISNIIFALIEQVTYRLRRENMAARTINIQLRTNNFIDFSQTQALKK